MGLGGEDIEEPSSGKRRPGRYRVESSPLFEEYNASHQVTFQVIFGLAFQNSRLML